MSKQRWTVQHTGRPFAGAIPEEAWRVLSKHTTLKAAEARLERELAEDDAICGPGAWRDHYRLSPLADMPMTDAHYCLGYLDRRGQSRYCPDDAAAETAYVWPAGEPEPAMQTPPGWAEPTQCAACAALERIERASS